MSDLSWLNPTPHAIAVYASRPLSPVATQHSLPSGRYSLLGPDFHRLDRASFAWRTHSITSSARASTESGMVKPSALAVIRFITSSMHTTSNHLGNELPKSINGGDVRTRCDGGSVRALLHVRAVRSLCLHHRISTKPTWLTRLLAVTTLPPAVTSIFRTISPPPGNGQV